MADLLKVLLFIKQDELLNDNLSKDNPLKIKHRNGIDKY